MTANEEKNELVVVDNCFFIFHLVHLFHCPMLTVQVVPITRRTLRSRDPERVATLFALANFLYGGASVMYRGNIFPASDDPQSSNVCRPKLSHPPCCLKMRKKINPEETVSISFEFILTIQLVLFHSETD